MFEITEDANSIAIHDQQDNLLVIMTMIHGKVDTLSSIPGMIIYVNGKKVN